MCIQLCSKEKHCEMQTPLPASLPQTGHLELAPILSTSFERQGYVNRVQCRSHQSKHPRSYDDSQVRVLRRIDDACESSREIEDEPHNVIVQVKERSHQRSPRQGAHCRDQDEEADNGKGESSHHEEQHPGDLVRLYQEGHHDETQDDFGYFDPSVQCLEISQV